MNSRKKVSIIIPAYNEEEKIGKTLKYLNFDWLKEIIVVNDGSQDNTLDIIQNYPVKVINFKKNRGKGKAIGAGLKKAQGEIIGLFDADLGKSISEINKIVKPVLKGKSDVTV
ncbi:MAG: glycosyltransferase family 2 protein, partial [bacterium]